MYNTKHLANSIIMLIGVLFCSACDIAQEIIVTPEAVTQLPALENMVLIPMGEFLIGSNAGDADTDEQPVRKVYIDSFYMDEKEVTNADFWEFVMANPEWQQQRIDRRFANTNYLQHWDGNNYPIEKADHPVTWVSWYAAMAYSQWVGKRLPTEAEWEYAARGGLISSKYPYGDKTTPALANYGNIVEDTTVVGQYPANGYGLYDMAGNVWEWCLDAYTHDFYATLPENSVSRNPISSENSIQWLVNNFKKVNLDRTMRGGAWNTSSYYIRVTSRIGNTLTGTTVCGGFRCVRSIHP